MGAGVASVLRLEDLLDREGQYAAAEPSGAYQIYEAVYMQGQRWVAAVQMIDFLVGKYGIDVLPRLLQAFGEYEDWETLAPAVLGVSAAELEAAWRADAKATWLAFVTGLLDGCRPPAITPPGGAPASRRCDSWGKD